MTSTVQVSNLFDNNLYSASAPFGRSMNDKQYGLETSFPVSTFNNGIWQSNKDEDFRIQRNNIQKSGSGREAAGRLQQNGTGWHSTRKELSLAMPNLKTNSFSLTNSGDRASPNQGGSGAIIQSGPLSAHSRSNNDSALLTPNSLTSSSDRFSQVDGAYTSRGQQNVVISTQPYQDAANIWNTAKEFQPSTATYQGRTLNASNAETSQKSSPSDSSRQTGYRPTTLKAIWNRTNEVVSFDPLQNWDDFRPVLAATQPFVPDSVHDRNRQREADRLNIAMQSNELMDRKNSPRHNNPDQLMQSQFQPRFSQPTIGITEPFKQVVAQPRKYWEPVHQNDWVKRSYTQGQNVRHASSDFVSCTNRQQLMVRNRAASNYPQNLTATSTDHAAPVDPRPQTYIDNYFPQSQQSYGTQSYANAFCPMTLDFVDTRLGQYIDPSIEVPYSISEQQPERQNDINRIYRSPLLEEFRMSKTKKYELKDIYDHIVEFSGDQIGSRFIQQKLEVANSEEKDRVFSEIAQDSRQLMTDVFGNYVIQKMFEHGNQSQKRLLASHMRGHVFALSTQTYGCRVVQKALEHILTDQQASLIKELDGCVLKVVENQNGNHVIQKAIERIPGEHIQFIIDAHRGHVHYLSKHSYGCRVIQRMLEHCTPRAKRQILDELHMNIGDLIQDPFGNYVVQHVIANGEHQDRKPVIDKVQANLLDNAMHKFASNVVEKALDYAEESQCRAMIRKLTGRDEHGQSQVMKLLGHQYGNYVIQKSAAHLTGHTLAALIEEMERYLTQLRRVSNGKQVSALEMSIRDARQRLSSQRHETNISNAPIQPNVSIGRQ